MRREKRLKSINIDRDTYRIMRKIWGSKVPYNPTIIDTEVKEKDGRQISSDEE